MSKVIEKKYQGREITSTIQAPNKEQLDGMIKGMRSYAKDHDLGPVQVLQRREDPDGGWEAIVRSHNFNPINWAKQKIGQTKAKGEAAQQAWDSSGGPTPEPGGSPHPGSTPWWEDRLRQTYQDYDSWDEKTKKRILEAYKKSTKEEMEAGLGAAEAGVRPETQGTWTKSWIRDTEGVPGHWVWTKLPGEKLTPAELRYFTEASKAKEEEIKLKTEMLKGARREQKLKPIKDIAGGIQKATTEVAIGGALGAAKGMSTNKAAMEQAGDTFTAQHPRELYTAPKYPPTTFPVDRAMITELPTRTHPTTSHSGRMIPAGQAVIGGSPAAKQAMVGGSLKAGKALATPSPAGGLLVPSVRGTASAQALLPSQPTRLGLSGLKAELNLGGLTSGGPLPKLKLRSKGKKNLYNSQLGHIRRLLK